MYPGVMLRSLSPLFVQVLQVFYTWVARSRSGSSSFTASGLNKPSSSSSSSNDKVDATSEDPIDLYFRQGIREELVQMKKRLRGMYRALGAWRRACVKVVTNCLLWATHSPRPPLPPYTLLLHKCSSTLQHMCVCACACCLCICVRVSMAA